MRCLVPLASMLVVLGVALPAAAARAWLTERAAPGGVAREVRQDAGAATPPD